MNKRGGLQLREETNQKCLAKSGGYMAAHNGLSIVRYRTARGGNYGVVVNRGDIVLLWDSFTERLGKFSSSVFAELLIEEVVTNV